MRVINLLQQAEHLGGMEALLDDALRYVTATQYDGGEKFSPWKDHRRDFSLTRAAFRSCEGHTHTMLVLDIDTKEVSERAERMHTQKELRKLQLEAAMRAQQQILSKDPNFFAYISGTGAYLVRRVEPAVPKSEFLPKVRALVDKCHNTNPKHKRHDYCEDWHEYNREIFRWWTIDGYQIRTAIDLNMIIKTGMQIFRVPYTLYTKIQGHQFVCVPTVFSRGTNIDIEATLHRSEPDNLTLEDFEVPVEIMDIDDTKGIVIDPEAIQRDTGQRRVQKYVKLNVPLPEEGLTPIQHTIVDKMEDLLTGPPNTTPPCIKNAYTKNMPTGHHCRVIFGRYLLHKGYTVDEIGMFIRFKVNDATDNAPSNLQNLEKNINYYIVPTKDNPRKLPRCSLMQEEGSDFYSCTPKDALICGRPYVMEDPRNTAAYRAKKRAERRGKQLEKQKEKPGRKRKFQKIIHDVKRLFANKRPVLVKKTTRAGLTTSLVVGAKEEGLRTLVLEPTNRIAKDTFPKAVDVAKDFYKMDIKGAVLSSNPKGCLILALKTAQLEEKKKREPDWGEPELQLTNLPMLLKPSCSNCKYFSDEYMFDPDDGVVIDSLVTEVGDEPHYHRKGEEDLCDKNHGSGFCARISVLTRLDDFEVVFATYAKIMATMSDIQKDEALVILSELKNFDVIMLDEISTLLYGQPNMIEIGYQRAGQEMKFKSDQIRREIAKLPERMRLGVLGTTVQECLALMERNLMELEMTFIRGGIRTIVIDNPLTPKQQKTMLAQYSNIQRVVEMKNLDLSLLAAFVLSLLEEEWYMTAVTNGFGYTAFTLVSKPELTMLKQFIRKMVRAGKKLVVTDAALPPMSMEKVLNIDKWYTHDLGDPRGTNELSLIIPDTRKVNITTLEKDNGEERERLLRFIDEVMELHAEEDTMIVFPTSGYAYSDMEEGIIKKYPGVEITYYRSDMTVGVESDRRTMVAICKPLPPEDSYNWLGLHYSREQGGDINGYSQQLRDHSMRQAFYQTVGRIKDPEAAEPSVVYCYGIRYSDVMDLIHDFSPPIVTKHRERGFGSRVMAGAHWRRTGEFLSPPVVSSINMITSKKSMRVARLQRIMSPDNFSSLMNNLSTFGLFFDEKSKVVKTVEVEIT